MTVTLYGIANCDTVKTARAWLNHRGVAHQFHDYGKAGVDPERLSGWIDRLGWEALLNRRGTTFRGLSEADKTDLDRDTAARLMAARPSLIKRPLVEVDDRLMVGFDAERWEAMAW